MQNTGTVVLKGSIPFTLLVDKSQRWSLTLYGNNKLFIVANEKSGSLSSYVANYVLGLTLSNFTSSAPLREPVTFELLKPLVGHFYYFI